MKRKHHKFFIGISTLLIFYNFLFINKKKLDDEYLIIQSEFNRIDGINENSEVRISGMQVGKVTSMQIINNKPQIKIALNKDLLIPDDSSLSIQTDGLFGKKYISLEPGGSEHFLNNGEKIFLTEDSILIQDLLKKIIEIGNLKKENYEK